jgi:hypothetical protein
LALDRPIRRSGANGLRFVAAHCAKAAGMTKIHPFLQHNTPEPTMFIDSAKTITQRLFSFSLAAVLTLGMLGGIDQLSAPAASPAGWAGQPSSNPHG